MPLCTRVRASHAAQRVQAPDGPSISGVQHGTYSHLRTLRDGDHFGEASCVLGQPSAAAVVARTFCKCLTLRGDDLELIMAMLGSGGSDGGESVPVGAAPLRVVLRRRAAHACPSSGLLYLRCVVCL